MKKVIAFLKSFWEKKTDFLKSFWDNIKSHLSPYIIISTIIITIAFVFTKKSSLTSAHAYIFMLAMIISCFGKDIKELFGRIEEFYGIKCPPSDQATSNDGQLAGIAQRQKDTKQKANRNKGKIILSNTETENTDSSDETEEHDNDTRQEKPNDDFLTETEKADSSDETEEHDNDTRQEKPNDEFLTETENTDSSDETEEHDNDTRQEKPNDEFLYETIKMNKEEIERWNDLEYIKQDLAHKYFYLGCERIYNRIYGTQIEFLKRLDRSKQGFSQNRIDGYFKKVSFKYPQYEKLRWSSGDYVHDLLANHLIEEVETEGQTLYTITQYGKDFLLWLDDSGMNKNKPW